MGPQTCGSRHGLPGTREETAQLVQRLRALAWRTVLLKETAQALPKMRIRGVGVG